MPAAIFFEDVTDRYALSSVDNVDASQTLTTGGTMRGSIISVVSNDVDSTVVPVSINSWTDLPNPPSPNFELADTTVPLRLTVSEDMVHGRFYVRALTSNHLVGNTRRYIVPAGTIPAALRPPRNVWTVAPGSGQGGVGTTCGIEVLADGSVALSSISSATQTAPYSVSGHVSWKRM